MQGKSRYNRFHFQDGSVFAVLEEAGISPGTRNKRAFPKLQLSDDKDRGEMLTKVMRQKVGNGGVPIL